jgi:MFS family permease
MTDDQTKRDPVAPGDDDEQTSPFRYLDRDQWYEDDERVVADPGEDTAAVADVDAEATAANPESELAEEPIPLAAHVDADEWIPDDSGQLPDVADTSELQDEQDVVSAEPDPYDFGDPLESDATTTSPPTEDVEPAPEPVREGERVSTAAALSGGLASMGAGWSSRAGGLFGRITRPIESQFAPLRGLVQSTTQRSLIVIAIAIGLISLLADDAGFALMVMSFVLPLLIVESILRRDVFEKEPPLILFGVGGAGLAAGLILSAISSWIVRERWFDSGLLNNGAAGYGGVYADRAGTAGFIVQFFVGLVIPILGLAAIIALPIYLRRYVQFRNEIMDGAILGAVGAAGFAIGASIIFFAPAIGDGLPRMQVSDWTLTSVAIVIVRPIILTLAGAMFGIAIWRYMREGRIGGMVLPVIGGAGIWMLLSLGTIQVEPSGISVEFLWNIVLGLAAYVLYQRSVAGAIAIDRAALGNAGSRMVCPSCRQVTPVGAFCANCGASLQE